jgi:hypothetical protein
MWGKSANLRSQDAVEDCLFLALVVLLSLILYIGDLGFYSDDWDFLRRFIFSPNQSFVGLFQSAYFPLVWMRPVQILYLTGLYWLFGLHPLGYHLVNVAILVSGIVLFYLVLRELEQERVLALAVAVLYALLPSYSENRFWMASFQITLSMSLYFLSLYSDLRALQSGPKGVWCWKLLSTLSLVGSTLAYEIFIPLFLCNPLIIWYRKRQLYKSGEQINRVKLAVLLGINLPILILIVFFKVAVTIRLRNLDFEEHIVWFFQLIKEAIIVSYVHYGIALPHTISKILVEHFNGSVLAVGGLLALVLAMYLYLIARQSITDLPSRAKMCGLTACGLAIFGIGYAIFLTGKDAPIKAIHNRATIAAAIGVALSQIGVLTWLTSTFLPTADLRKRCFCVPVSVLCMGGFLINNTVASFWVAAYRQEQEVLAHIRRQFPALPVGSTLILDGVCRYIRGVPVFESNYDLAGALQIAYKNPTLGADVVRPNFRVTHNGLVTLLYDEEHQYPYERLLVYNLSREIVYRLDDAEAAHRYFRTVHLEHRCIE